MFLDTDGFSVLTFLIPRDSVIDPETGYISTRKSTCHKQSRITSFITCFICGISSETLSGGRNVIAVMAHSKSHCSFCFTDIQFAVCGNSVFYS